MKNSPLASSPRWILAAILGLALSLGMFAAAPSTAVASPVGDEVDRPVRVELRGQIVEVVRGGFTMVMRDGTKVRVAVSDRTRISINGRPARLGDLQPRDHALVDGYAERTPRGVTMDAITVQVRR